MIDEAVNIFQSIAFGLATFAGLGFAASFAYTGPLATIQEKFYESEHYRQTMAMVRAVDSKAEGMRPFRMLRRLMYTLRFASIAMSLYCLIAGAIITNKLVAVDKFPWVAGVAYALVLVWLIVTVLFSYSAIKHHQASERSSAARLEEKLKEVRFDSGLGKV